MNDSCYLVTGQRRRGDPRPAFHVHHREGVDTGGVIPLGSGAGTAEVARFWQVQARPPKGRPGVDVALARRDLARRDWGPLPFSGRGGGFGRSWPGRPKNLFRPASTHEPPIGGDAALNGGGKVHEALQPFGDLGVALVKLVDRRGQADPG